MAEVLEEILRRELHALSRDHVESIAAASGIGIHSPRGIKGASREDLFEAIVGEASRAAVRSASDSSAERLDL